MTIDKKIGPKKCVSRLDVSRKNVGKELTGCENGGKKEENDLCWYVKNNIESLLVAVRTSRTIHMRKQLTLKNSRKLRNRKNEWAEKGMHGQFARIRTIHGDGWEKVI